MQSGNETSNAVWGGDDGTDEKTRRGESDGCDGGEDGAGLSGVTRMDNIRNEYIRGTPQAGRFGEKRREARLRWLGFVRRI